MKIVLTNDDGVDAPGLHALYLALEGTGEMKVVAPQESHFAMGHGVTTRSPIKVREIGKHRFGVDGTPADCTRLALKVVFPEADWVIAGINPGANLGSDVYQSGTVAAAREAAILGCRAIAISQYVAKDHQIGWDITKHHAEAVLKMLLRKHLDQGYFWNVNLPHPLNYISSIEYVYCDIDPNPHQYLYRKEGEGYVYEGTIHDRPRDSGRDVDVCFGGQVSMTRIPITPNAW